MSGRIGASAGVSYGDRPGGPPMDHDLPTASGWDPTQKIGDAFIGELERAAPEIKTSIAIADAVAGAQGRG